jgi:Holliday junction resolvase-like predicted endonuclease
VTPAKQARLAALAEAYCDAAGWTGPRRIDVVAVSFSADGRLLEVRQIENAI